jgi:hypothetical protein
LENGLFLRLRSHLPGPEDAFTAFLALAANEVPELGQEIIGWLAARCPNDAMPQGSWQFQGQLKFPKRSIDMAAKCRATRTEVWFEHKVGAPEGTRNKQKGDPKGQVKQYFDLAARKCEDPEYPADRILIAYISLDEEHKISGSESMVDPNGKARLLNRDGKALAWSDLYEKLDLFRMERRSRLPPYEQWLLDELLDYWAGQAGMCPRIPHHGSWRPDVRNAQNRADLKKDLRDGWHDLKTRLKDLPSYPTVSFQNESLGLCLNGANDRVGIKISLERTTAGEDDDFPDRLREKHRKGALVRVSLTTKDGTGWSEPPQRPPHTIMGDRKQHDEVVAFVEVLPDASDCVPMLPAELGCILAAQVFPVVCWMSDGVQPRTNVR